jgi:hypothetical protein
MPTDIDVKLAEGLADFRLETERRFGALDRTLAAINTELRLIRFIGVFFAGVLVAVAAGAGRVVWDAATLTAEVRQHGVRLDKVEKRLDGIDAKLDTLIRLIRRSEPKTGG